MALAQAVKVLGRIDCAFNNPGVENKAAPLHGIELEEWDRILTLAHVRFRLHLLQL